MLFPAKFPSHELLQGFNKCETVFSSPHSQLMTCVLMKLMIHNIEKGTPSIWIRDLKFLVLVPEGIHYLNNFPLVYIKQAKSVNSFWNILYDIWMAHFKGIELNELTNTLLALCSSVFDLVGFLGFFSEEKELSRIHLKNRINN